MRHCANVAHMSSDDYLSTPQVAAELHVSTRTVHRMVTAGALVPALTAPGGPHGAYLFTRAEVERVKEEAAA